MFIMKTGHTKCARLRSPQLIGQIEYSQAADEVEFYQFPDYNYRVDLNRDCVCKHNRPEKAGFCVTEYNIERNWRLP